MNTSRQALMQSLPTLHAQIVLNAESAQSYNSLAPANLERHTNATVVILKLEPTIQTTNPPCNTPVVVAMAG